MHSLAYGNTFKTILESNHKGIPCSTSALSSCTERFTIQDISKTEIPLHKTTNMAGKSKILTYLKRIKPFLAGYNLYACMSRFRTCYYETKKITRNKHGQLHNGLSRWQYTVSVHNTLCRRGYNLDTYPSHTLKNFKRNPLWGITIKSVFYKSSQ